MRHCLLLAAAALCVPLTDWDTEEPIVPLTPHHHTAREEATAAAMSEFAEQLEHPSEVSYANQMKLGDMLNERFMNGHPSNNFSEAGVVMHQFDDSGFDTTTRRLREGGVSKWSPWLPCPEGQWCSKFGDRFSVSVLNARVPFSFNEYNGGIIINPDTAQRGTMCAWASDARSFRAALAQAARGVCKAARGVPWRRQCVALADACGVLDAAFGDGATDAVDDAAWRARFVDVWTRRRHKWRGGADPGGSFSIRAVVRFRPRLVAASETDHGGVFLPLHQRLQLRKLGHNTPCLETEVCERLGPVGESVETYADRQRRRRSEARRALRASLPRA